MRDDWTDPDAVYHYEDVLAASGRHRLIGILIGAALAGLVAVGSRYLETLIGG